MPPGDVLLGQHGIYPWYRPLSRELFFYLLLATEPAARAVAHGLALATVAVSAWALFVLGERWVGRRGGVAAAALFVTYDTTKFLAGWASGFQDLLATMLMLVAVVSHVRGRVVVALLCAGLAPFAKETGFLVWPLLAWISLVDPATRPARQWMGAHALVLLGAVLAHLGVRLLWRSGGTAFTIVPSAQAVLEVVAQAAGWFVSWGLPPSALATGMGLAAIAILAAWFRAVPDGAVAAERSPRTAGLLAGCSALGLAPLVAGHALRLFGTNAYYAYPAAPWIALLLAWGLWRLPERSRYPVTLAWVLLNLWGLGYQSPDVNRISSWVPMVQSWRETVRVSAVTGRFVEDLHRELGVRAPGTVVLYDRLPYGSFFHQSTDGPATREILRDPSVRAYYVGEAPTDVPAERLVVLAFDPIDCHLKTVPRDPRRILRDALARLAQGEPRGARILVRYAQLDARSPEAVYVLAAAALLERGPDAYLAVLRAAALDDTTGEGIRARANELAAGERGVAKAFERMLREPRSAAAHRALADSLLVRGAGAPAGVELRSAIALGIDTSEEHYLLGLILARHGARDLARRELEHAVAIGSPPAAAAEARAMLAELAAAGDAPR